MIEAPVIAIKRRHVTVEVDRHGNERYYFRVGHGRRVRLTEKPGSEEFDLRYHELVRQAHAGELRPAPHSAARPCTFRWLAQTYMVSTEFRSLDPRTQRVRRQILNHIFDEPIRPGANEKFGDRLLAHFTPMAVKIIRDRKRDAPEGANARVKAIRAVYKWALDPMNEIRAVSANPARDVPYLKPKRPGGLPTWTLVDIEQYYCHHPVGTKARLALDLLIYTGARRSDVIRLGRQNVKGQVLSFIAFKGRNKAPVQVDLPILAELAAALDVGPVGDMVFLVTEHGKPYTQAGFGNWFRRQCDEAGLEGRSAHGLRKAAAVTAAENGATPHELQAIFGWKTLKEAERYTTAANRKDLAMRSPHLLSRADREQKSLTSSAQTPPVRENGRKV